MTNKYPIGSQWKTRAGHRAVVVEHQENTFLAFNSHFKEVYRHKYNGSHNVLMNGNFDILTPWTEPRKGTFWVNVYPCRAKLVHNDKEDADQQASEGRLACVRCDWTEGDGL